MTDGEAGLLKLGSPTLFGRRARARCLLGSGGAPAPAVSLAGQLLFGGYCETCAFQKFLSH